LRKELRGALRDEVRAEFAPQWRDYALEKQKRDEKAQLYDREARRAIRHLRGVGGTRQAVVEMVKGKDGRTYRKRRGVESEAIEQIKARQKDYHARQREELWEMRSGIASSQKERLEELSGPALDRLSKDRGQAYAEILKDQRGERAALGKDQASGERRHDVLSGYGAASATSAQLTPEQVAGYIAHARTVTARNAEFDQVRSEVTDADRGRSPEPARDLQDKGPPKEASDRSQEKNDKDQAQEAKRKSGLDWYLEKRAADRARDRDGGRDR
jgi:hypothetical protein